MTNPFIYGKTVDGSHFIDREDEVAGISQSLLAGQNVICYSPRRFGKTSMMLRVKESLGARGHLVFFIDLFRVTAIEDLYNIYASSIVQTLRSPLQSLLDTLQNILPNLNPKISISGTGTPTVEVSVPLPVLTKPATLRELFDSLEVYCAKKRKKGTVIFDEFQEIASIADGKLIEREMRSAFQLHRNVTYAFLGSKQHLLKGIFKSKNRPFYNFGRHFDLDVIAPEHWRVFIARRMGNRCSSQCIDRILNATEDHPHYTQMLCHHLWDHAQQRGSPIDERSVETVMRDILERDSMFFAELWNEISARERQLCKAIAARSPRSLYEKSFIAAHNLGTASSVQKAAAKLLRLDYIRKRASGEICFVNPFMKAWILRTSAA